VFDAYAGERAKLLAQFHSLDQLVEQTGKLTETTKLIESRVSYDLWDRQMRWTAKRDMYIRVLESIGEQLDVQEHCTLLERIRRNDPGNALYPQERDKALLRSQQVHARASQVGCTAPLEISPDAHQILIELSQEIRHVHYDAEDFENDSSHNTRVLQGALNNLFVEARKDLGFDQRPFQTVNPDSRGNIRSD